MPAWLLRGVAVIDESVVRYIQRITEDPDTKGEKMYQLTAMLNSKGEDYLFEASSDDAATMDAIGVIMDNAYADKTGPWALGAITLTDPEGNVIHTMAAK